MTQIPSNNFHSFGRSFTLIQTNFPQTSWCCTYIYLEVLNQCWRCIRHNFLLNLTKIKPWSLISICYDFGLAEAHTQINIHTSQQYLTWFGNLKPILMSNANKKSIINDKDYNHSHKLTQTTLTNVNINKTSHKNKLVGLRHTWKAYVDLIFCMSTTHLPTNTSPVQCAFAAEQTFPTPRVVVRILQLKMEELIVYLC